MRRLLVTAAIATTTLTTGIASAQSVDFGFTSAYVAVPNDPDLSPTAGLTVEAWVRQDAQTLRATLVRKDPAVNAESYTLRLQFGIPQLIVRTQNNGVHVLTSPSSLPINVNHHVAGTYDGSTSQIYVDGVLVAEETHNGGPIVPSTGELRIGNGDTSGNENLFGTIDEVRLWDHARTNTEIAGGLDRRLNGGDGLIASWHFEGDLGDAAGTHDGTAMGPVSYTPDLTVFAQSATYPLGTAGYVEVPHSADQISPTGLTLEAWVIRTDLSATHACIIRKNPATGSEAYVLRMEFGFPNFIVRDVDGTTHNTWDLSAVIPINTPTHIAATYDGATSRIFVDGVLKKSTTINKPLIADTGVLRIGRGDDSGPNEQWVGNIDAVRIWKVARSQKDIAATMNREIPSMPGLVASYEFNGDATDSVAGNNGSVLGGSVDLDHQVGDTIGIGELGLEVIGTPTTSCANGIESVAFGLPYQGQVFGFGAVNAPPLTPGFILISSGALASPVTVEGMDLFVDPFQPIFFVFAGIPSNASGQARIGLTAEVSAATIGASLTMQWVFPDTCTPGKFQSSDGLKVTFYQ